jgi:hypothetical protein
MSSQTQASERRTCGADGGTPRTAVARAQKVEPSMPGVDQ